jgi:hypothetical protein
MLYTDTVFFSFGSAAPIWVLTLLHETLRFTSIYYLRRSVGLLGRCSASTGTQTGNRTHTHTPNMHALSGIRVHDPGFRASEDSACLRLLGYRDRPPTLCSM